MDDTPTYRSGKGRNSGPPVVRYNLPNGDELVSVREDILAAALRNALGRHRPLSPQTAVGKPSRPMPSHKG